MTEIEILKIVFASGTAAIVCFFTAMTGSGSGLIIVPLLTFLGLTPVQAIAIHKFEAALWTTASAVRYVKEKKVLYLDFPWYLIFGSVGTFIGARLIHLISDEVLKMVVGIAIIVVGIWMIAFHKKPERKNIALWKRILLVVSMFFFGIYEGTFGSGNGYFIAALFFSLIGSDELKTVGMITLLATIWNFIAVGTHLTFGSLLLNYAVPVGVSSAIGAWLGAGFAIKQGAKFVRWVIIIGAFIAGAAMILM